MRKNIWVHLSSYGDINICYKGLQNHPKFQNLYVMNQSVGEKSAHLRSFLEQLVFCALSGLL